MNKLTNIDLAILILAAAIVTPTSAQTDSSEIKPVRMGCGLMTFDTVPGWGLRPDGQSAIGATHGSIVVDQAGYIYTSSSRGVFVFSAEGKVVKSFEKKDLVNIHDMEIRDENGVEYIYGARNDAGKGIKFDAKSGEIVLELPFPKESGLDLKKFNPTAITVAANGDIYLSDGYASNHIFVFDKTGKYLFHFGEKGNGGQKFNVAHGMTVDNRYQPPRLLICDRNHKPKGRLLHYSLEGEFIQEVISGLGMPTAVAIQGDFVSIPDLHGRLYILDRENVIMTVLGFNPDRKQRGNYNVRQADWIEGIFSGTHASYWDADGNLYVQDWNVDGRIMKLNRAKP